jgi:hypothetical protein
MHVRVTSARRNGGDFLPCRAGEGAGTMTAHFKERPMNRTTHLIAQSALGAARRWARSVDGMGLRSAGRRPASPI